MIVRLRLQAAGSAGRKLGPEALAREDQRDVSGGSILDVGRLVMEMKG